MAVFITVVMVLALTGCQKKDKLYEKAKANIVAELPYPSSYKLEYIQKGQLPHITSSGFIAVNSDKVYKIKYLAKDKDGIWIHCYAYVMFDVNGNIVGKEILPVEIAAIDELLGINKKERR